VWIPSKENLADSLQENLKRTDVASKGTLSLQTDGMKWDTSTWMLGASSWCRRVLPMARPLLFFLEIIVQKPLLQMFFHSTNGNEGENQLFVHSVESFAAFFETFEGMQGKNVW
jgi:hypothetical protein